MTVKELLNSKNVLLDGGMGTLLQAKGLKPGECSEEWNVSHPEEITAVHKAYFDAGSNIIYANTFGINLFKYSEEEAERLIKAAMENAFRAKAETEAKQPKFVSFDIGSVGRLLKPLGTLDFEEAVAAFRKAVLLGVKYGAELITVETMTDCYETKAALLAAKEVCSLPVIVTNAYGENGRLLTGGTPEGMVAMLEGMGADAVGVNCSLGPVQLLPVIKKYLAAASVPVVFKPNAGLPAENGGKMTYDITADEFASVVAETVKDGVRVFGGCCGTTPGYISRLAELTKDIGAVPVTEKNSTVVSSFASAVTFGGAPVLIGERINPTGKKRFRQALCENDVSYVLSEATKQTEAGVDMLDVNVGIPDIDEKTELKKYVSEIQGVTAVPLQLDTSDPAAMENALRIYNGKAMINSVNGKAESMEAVFPLVKKYGGVAVALTLDENGIPSDADGRVKIAEKIIAKASEYGIKKKDIVFDTLCLTVSADGGAAKTTLEAMRRIKEELGCHTVLGVSNISFGLPNRDIINGAFFTSAMEKGLSSAIMNPYSAEMMKSYYAFRALHGLDESCGAYIEYCSRLAPQEKKEAAAAPARSALFDAIVKGLKAKAGSEAEKLLSEKAPLDIVNGEVIPALDEVGKGFEQNRIYLPGLLMSAEAAKSAFEVIKKALSGKEKAEKCPFVLATVKGDIHDIGKNIVKLLLENYGYEVIDLGKNVEPEAVVQAVIESGAPFAGLSALMTTTVPAMEETVKLLKEKAPGCRVVVGGAVLNEEYAAKIGADKYAPDAMATVRYAEALIK